MSIGISLSPPSTDISVGLLSSLLGPKWWLLATGQAPSGAGSILGTMFSVFDIALLMYVSALLVYQATVGGMATAHEGTPLGRRYHSIWAPIRGPAAFAMLFPLPWAKGLALIQCIALLAVYWGIGVADDVWNAFVQEIPKMSGVIMPSRQSIDRDNQFVTKALMMATVQEYLIQRANMPLGGRWVWRGGVNSGDWIFTQYLTKGSSAKSGSTKSTAEGAATKQFIAGLGTIEISCSNNMQHSTGTNEGIFGGGWISGLGVMAKNAFNWTANVVAQSGLPGSQLAGSMVEPAQNNKVCVSEMTAISNTMKKIYPIAEKIVKQNAQTNAGPILSSEIAKAVSAYQTEQATAYNEMNHDKQAALMAQTKAFANEASSLGWASSSFYYWTLNNINAASQAYLKMLQPQVSMPNMAYVEQSTGNYIVPSLLAADSVISHYESSDNYVSGAESVATTGMPKGGILSSGSGTSWMGGKIMNIVSSLDSGNPLANMVSAGHTIILAGGAVIAGPSTLIAAAKTVGAAGGFIGGLFIPGADAGASETAFAIVGSKLASLAASKIAGAAARAVTSMGSVAKKAALPIGLFMMVEGAIIAYVIPSIPGVIMIFAVIGWVFLTMELLVAAPLWAAAHAYAEGEGFAPQMAQYGYSAAVSIIARPVLLTFGFVIMFFMIYIIGHFVGSAMTIYMMGMNGFHIGIIGSVAILAIIIGTIWGSMKLVMKLITNLADRVPQYLGGRGESSVGEAQEAMHSAQGGAEKAKGLAVGAYGVTSKIASQNQIGDLSSKGAKKEGGKKPEKPDKKDKSETNASTSSNNISGGDTTGKGEIGDSGSSGTGEAGTSADSGNTESGNSGATNASTGADSGNMGSGDADGKSEGEGAGNTGDGDVTGKGDGGNGGGQGQQNRGASSMDQKYGSPGTGGSFGKGFRAGRKVRSWITGEKFGPQQQDSAPQSSAPGNSGGDAEGKTEESPASKSGPSGSKNEQKDA